MNEETDSLLDNFDLRDRSVKEKMQIAVHLYDNKQYEFAHQVIKNSLKDHPDEYHGNFLLGLTLLNLNRASEAEETFKHVIQSSPDSARAHFQISLIFLSKEEMDFAIHHMSRAIELTPQESHNIGRRFYLRGIMRLIVRDVNGLDDLQRANDFGWDCSDIIEAFRKNDCQDCVIDEM